MRYKDLVMPGTTWIKTFTLEHDSILYSRDPDWYTFRIAHLPSDLTSSPHPVSISMNNIQTGPPIHKYYQPRNTELHDVMLARLYSPEQDTYRVLSLDLLSDYDDIAGMHVNEASTILAIWTDSNTVYIYRRNASPHNRVVPLGWSLRMVIKDLKAARVGTIAFWERQEKNYMVIGLKNQKVRSYLIDESEQAEKPGFWHFLIERWNMLTAMSVVIAVFVFNESHRPSV
ncbi:hypothetical protein BDB00DRAFT_766356 [Zychaea mexicana]|uniref:uncharacterized protein n=1 Tax=Zychaea mexicana TaxID=64656 RepID=UPI0022FEF85E|nr:uncharacterized protein BDB00DRAFT_766356 [Zychaea mexicana]KAI9491903.1 hypothetical protein BDB00DRAFT_766356 [Zychaea mexicana]